MREFLSLTKPTISLLVVITGAAGLVWQGSLLGDPMRFIGVLVGLFLASGCANGLNQYFERDLDALMERTAKKRPLASKRMKPAAGLAFALSCGVLGVTLFAVFYNMLAASLALGVSCNGRGVPRPMRRRAPRPLRRPRPQPSRRRATIRA